MNIMLQWLNWRRMMRDTFLTTLTSLAEKDRNIILLTADLGYGVFEEFESRFPGQYFNVGVAEQNMTGIASGLSLEGKKVVTYSIGNFPTLRCLEQIRNDACYHDANITIVASGGGFSYGGLGMSHHATEDLAILRALPNISVVAPCTASESGEAISAMIQGGGVNYLRLDKTVAQDSDITSSFAIGKSRRHKEGSDITLIAIGGILDEVNIAAVKLKRLDIDVRVIGMHSIKPIDIDEIIDAATNTGGIVTVEEHNKDGGLGSAVSEVCMDLGVMPKKFLRIGLDNIYSSIVGGQQYLRSRYEMDSEAIVNKVKEILNS
jgi:transketolase